MSVYQAKLCERWTGKKNLDCLPEDLVFVGKLPDSESSKPFYKTENHLKACRICGQVYRETISFYSNPKPIKHFHKIPGNLVDQCHCIGYLQEVEILLERKICEDDSMYFAMEKETKMRCEKCGKYYIESIYQNNYDAVFFQTYSEFKSK